MKRVTRDEEYVEETWLVAANKGLANCVVTLKAKKPENRLVPKALEKVVLDKVGVRYVPRVLIVTHGTQVVFRNKESPCRGFHVRGSKPLLGNNFWYNVPEGSENKAVFRGPDICSITCPVRPYAQGYIHVVDTPYYAVTDTKGTFTIRGVQAGEYQVTVWHEAVGRLTRDAGPVEVGVTDKNDYALRFKVSMPVAK
jgi:hypothetical protein